MSVRVPTTTCRELTLFIFLARRLRGGDVLTLPAPKCVADYQRWMGGVDIHDQLRLQTFSLQRAFVFKKYNKSIFLGLVDVALVNAYIVFREHAKQRGEPTPAHDKFLVQLQCELLRLNEEIVDSLGVSSHAHRSNMRRNNRTEAEGSDMLTWCI